MTRQTVFSVVCLVALCAPGSALADERAQVQVGESLPRREKPGQAFKRFAPARQGLFNASWAQHQRAPLGAGLDSSYQDYSLSLNFPLWLDRDFVVVGSASYAQQFISWSGPQRPGGRLTLHQPAFALVHVANLGPDWRLISRGQVRFSSDLEGEVDQRDMAANAQVLASHILNHEVQITFGATLLWPWDISPVWPILGATWRPMGSALRLEVLVPSHVELGLALTQRLDAFTRVQLGGGRWDLQSQQLSLQQSELRASAGLDLELTEGVHLWGDAGVVAWRMLEATKHGSGQRRAFYQQPNAFGRLGMYVTGDVFNALRRR